MTSGEDDHVMGELNDYQEWLQRGIREDAERKIEAALVSAAAALPQGAGFLEVWEAAREAEPAAFGEAEPGAADQRITAALKRARSEAEPGASFEEVWQLAASLSPHAFT